MKHKTTFEGRTRHGNPADLVRHYEGRAYGALKEGDAVMAHLLFQHAEHYKRREK